MNGGTDLLLEFNVDADVAAEMSILLTGRTAALFLGEFVG